MKHPFKSVLRYSVLAIISLISVFPLVWMMLSSLKTGREIIAPELTLFPQVPQWQNFLAALEIAPFGLYMWNSFISATSIVVLQLLFASLFAYGLTQLHFKGRNVLFMLVLGTYMLPSAAIYIPDYVILARMDLLDSLAGFILSNSASVFSVFLLRQQFLKIPKELFEAARSAGATEWRIYRKIVLPMSKTSLFTAGLISFIGVYNSYLWPSLIMTNEKNFLITIGLTRFFTSQGAFSSKWPLIMAGSVISVLPLIIIFVVFQKYLMKGISSNGVKG